MTDFYSSFTSPDPRWKVRNTGDMPVADFATRYTDKGRMQMGLAERAGQIYTSQLATLDHPFVFGRFTARMRFPAPKGAHSAFWLQDAENPYGPGGSEVDIIEHFGENRLWHNVYYRTPESAPWPHKEAKRLMISKRENGIDPREWHNYACEWHPDKYVFFIDGEQTGVIYDAPSSKPKVMILSLLSSDYEWDDRQDDNLSVYRTMVDWVKVSPL